MVDVREQIKKHKLIIPVMMLFLFSLVGLFESNTVKAAASPDYLLSPSYPDNQIDKNAGYYNLLVQPGQEQTITVNIANKASKSRTMLISLNTAYTNQGGTAVYDKLSKVPKDNTRKVNMQDLVVGPRSVKVKLAPNELGHLDFNIKVPSNGFKGVVMGGFYASVVGETNKTVSKNGTVLQNVFGYGIPVFIRTTRDPVTPQFKLNTIKPGVRDGKTSILVNTQNTNPAYADNLKVDAKVTKKGSSDVLKHDVAGGMTIAPNSNFDYAIKWVNSKGNSKELQPGKYHLSWHGTLQGSTQSWHFERDFTVSDNDANRLNKLAGIKPNYLWLWILIAVLVLILILLIGYLMGRKNKNNNSTNGRSSRGRSTR